jgi:hypothetical protein
MTWVFIDVPEAEAPMALQAGAKYHRRHQSTSSTAATRIQPDLPAGVVYPTRLMGARILISGSSHRMAARLCSACMRSLFYVAFRRSS